MVDRRLADGLMSTLAGALVRVFFRDLEVTGATQLPSHGPVLLVANHQNGLVDGLVLIAALRRYPRFLGKSTLWKILPLRPFLALAGGVPIYRAADARSDPAGISPHERGVRNDQAFSRCRHLLAAGGMVAVFPEGISHDELRLQPVRSGAARIALGAAGDDAVVGLRVAAAGLVYDDKSRFRSRALVRLGPARPIDRLAEQYRVDPPGAVEALTEQISADLRTVAPDFETRDLAARCLDIADLVVDGAASAPVGLAERERVADDLARLALSADSAAAFEALSAAAGAYRHHLALWGLDDAQVATTSPGRAERRAVILSGAKVVAAAPLAAVGVMVHLVPYGIMKQVGRRPANVGMRATVKLLGCFGLFSLTYLGLAAGVGRRRGARAAVATLFSAPVCGWVALLCSERLARMGGVARSVDAVRHHQAGLSSLRARRAEVVERAGRLLELAAR